MTRQHIRISQRSASMSGMALLLLSAAAGCQLCCPPYMDDYATVGGKWSRLDPTRGRVGSAFSDPGATRINGTMPGEPMDGWEPIDQEFEDIDPHFDDSPLEFDDLSLQPDLEAFRRSPDDGVIILGH